MKGSSGSVVAWIAAPLLLAFGAIAFAGTPSSGARTGFKIVSPANGSIVADPVKLRIAVHGVTIGTPSSGGDHLHIQIDGGEVLAMYHNHTVTLNLPAGKHTINVDLAYPTHMPAAPWQHVTFNVR